MAGGSFSRILRFNQEENKKTQISEVRVGEIRPNPYQPRKYFDSVQLEELSKSLQMHGMIQPVIVRKKKDRYELVAGERRWRAAQMIGLETIPAIVKTLDDKDMAEVALIENLQREDLNYFEEAEGYKKLTEEFKLTQEEIAKSVGKSQSTIANKLRLLKLDKEVKDNINAEIITERHARALLKLPDKELQLQVLKEIYECELNVRETELRVEMHLQGEKELKTQDKRKKIIRIFKDIRIYLNAIKSTVAAIEKAGLDVEMKEVDHNDYIQVIIQIGKKKNNRLRLE